MFYLSSDADVVDQHRFPISILAGRMLVLNPFQLRFLIGFQDYFCWEADWLHGHVTQHYESGEEVCSAELAERVSAFSYRSGEK